MPDAISQIAFQQIGLASILKQYRLAVPANQREYKWSREYVKKLLQDFARAVQEEDSQYFMGMVVTIPTSNEVLEVVDGQQRLASTAILLAAIRNYLDTINERLIVEDITNKFLTDTDRAKRERVPKLQLNVDDNEVFKNLITDGVAPPDSKKISHENLRDAMELARQQVKSIVSGLDEKDHGNVLNRWIEFMEHRAIVILLKVPSDVNAYKMFETLNDRGLKTSQADLIKNYIFGQAGTRLPEAQHKWAAMRGSLEALDDSDPTVQFLRHALMNISGYVKESNVYESVQKTARGSHSSIAFLTSIEMLASYYAAMFNPESEKWNNHPDTMRHAIKALNLFDIQPLRPLMLATATKFTPNEAASAFMMFISLGVRLLIASSTRSGGVETPLATAATAVYGGEITTVKELKKRLGNIIPNDAQFRQGFESASVSKAKLARYYLRSLEMAAKEEPNPGFIPNDDKETINLEHILPQVPEGYWPQFDEDSVRANVRKVGNLALLIAKDNSNAKSTSFEEKKEIYAKSAYETTRLISDFNEWTPESIDARQKVLATLAVKAWPI